MPAQHPARQGWLDTFTWSAYLACSWTWCIGMFLPVLLVRDFGIWGFIAFAVPNVIGAAAVGWVLKSRDAATALARNHAPAIRAFSEATWAFHLFFLAWLLLNNPTMGWKPLTALIGLVVVTYVLIRESAGSRKERLWAVATWCLSAGAMIWILVNPGPQASAVGSVLNPAQLVFLAPVCALGFLLCPFLDVTLLRARSEQTTTSARTSFTIGFAGLFLVMILFTLLYARFFASRGDPIVLVFPTTTAASLIIIHMALQVFFTNGVHGSASRHFLKSDLSTGRRGTLAGLLIIACFLLIRSTSGVTYAGLSIGEITYRGFMALYGLVFPAYIWLCVIPAPGEVGTHRPSPARLRLVAAVIILAAPFYWMGFIERQTWWLGPGLFIVLVSRLALPREPAPRTA